MRRLLRPGILIAGETFQESDGVLARPADRQKTTTYVASNIRLKGLFWVTIDVAIAGEMGATMF